MLRRLRQMVIRDRFHTREGNAEDFYDNDEEVQIEENTFAVE